MMSSTDRHLLVGRVEREVRGAGVPGRHVVGPLQHCRQTTTSPSCASTCQTTTFIAKIFGNFFGTMNKLNKWSHQGHCHISDFEYLIFKTFWYIRQF